MVVSEIRLFQIAKEKFGEKNAEEFVNAIKGTIDEKFSDKKDLFATKVDLSEAKAEIIKWMFIFLSGFSLAVIGTIAALFKLFLG